MNKIIHYSRTKLDKYSDWMIIVAICGRYVRRGQATNLKEDVSCGSCERTMKQEKAYFKRHQK